MAEHSTAVLVKESTHRIDNVANDNTQNTVLFVFTYVPWVVIGLYKLRTC